VPSEEQTQLVVEKLDRVILLLQQAITLLVRIANNTREEGTKEIMLQRDLR
jgi:hypothetical protein